MFLKKYQGKAQPDRLSMASLQFMWASCWKHRLQSQMKSRISKWSKRIFLVFPYRLLLELLTLLFFIAIALNKSMWHNWVYIYPDINSSKKTPSHSMMVKKKCQGTWSLVLKCFRVDFSIKPDQWGLNTNTVLCVCFQNLLSLVLSVSQAAANTWWGFPNIHTAASP